MKKKILFAKLISAVMGSSSKTEYEYSGNCIICGKQAHWNSIGFCDKHYSLEKELLWREIKPKSKKADLSTIK
jgi:hypothetical protein